jgi:hypothetical protein
MKTTLRLLLITALALTLTLSSEAQEKRSVGKIVEIEKNENQTTYVINLGENDGIKRRDHLTVFGWPRIVSIPGSDETALQKEEPIGTFEVVEVSRESCKAVKISDIEFQEEPEKEMHVIPAPKAVTTQVAPHIRSLTPTPDVIAWGTPILLTVEATDNNNDIFSYDWKASAGAVTETATLVPTPTWYPPAEAGTAQITVGVTDLGGRRSEKVFDMAVAAPTAIEASEYFAVRGVYGGKAKHFLAASDIAFDDDNSVYILDRSLRRVIHLNADWSLAWFSTDYDFAEEYVSLRLFENGLFLLDQKSAVVRRFDKDPRMFTRGPTRTIAQRGVGNGHLREPTSFTIADNGFLYILDKFSNSVQVFDADGVFQVSFGGPGGTRGLFRRPTSVTAVDEDTVVVLDADRRVVMTYRNFLFDHESKIQDDGIEPLDLERDPISGHVYLICRDRILKYGSDFKKPYRTIHPAEGQLDAIDNALGGLCDRFGTLYVQNAGGATMLRFDGETGGFTGAWGAADVEDVDALSVSPAGSFYMLDVGESIIWDFDRQGWLRAAHRPAAEGLEGTHRPIRIEAAPDGLYVLDAGKRAVLRLTAGNVFETLIQFGVDVPGMARAMAVRDDGIILVEDKSEGPLALRLQGKDGKTLKGPVALPANLKDHYNIDVFSMDDGRILIYGDRGSVWEANLDALRIQALDAPELINLRAVMPGDTGRAYGISRLNQKLVFFGGDISEPIAVGTDGRYGDNVLDIDTDALRHVYVMDRSRRRVVKLAPLPPQKEDE